jgi:ribosomal protein L7/L12
MKIQSKQVNRILAAAVRVSGLAVATTTSSTVVTTPITTALTTAGDGGTAVTLAVSSGTGAGVITTGANNRVEIYNNTTKDKVLAANGEEVYARLTEAGAVYTLNYFTLPNSGTETAYTFPAAATVDFEFGYRFNLQDLPIDAIIGQRTRNISDDAAGGGGALFGESLSITAANTIAALTKTPVSQSTLEVIINGQQQRPGLDFTLSGKTITWVPATALFDLATTDACYVLYPTLE